MSAPEPSSSRSDRFSIEEPEEKRTEFFCPHCQVVYVGFDDTTNDMHRVSCMIDNLLLDGLEFELDVVTGKQVWPSSSS